jgi:pimeloyl-ACP methyl ester carboxylesterase
MISTQPFIDPQLSEQLKGVVSKLDLIPDPKDLATVKPGSGRRKRGYNPNDPNHVSKLSLISDNEGILRWVYQPAVRSPSSRRARRAARQLIAANAIHEIDIKDTSPNEVWAKIAKLDKELTPNQGLRLLKGGKWTPVANIEVPKTERTLLFVHGTFSKSDMYTEELGVVAKANPKLDLLGRALARYKHVLAFEHPTLSVSPWINALDLERALVKVAGPIDVICHSRGGLVVAWWLRNGQRDVENVIFVASPLQGTSLASPANLRSTLDVLANIASVAKITAGATATFLPFMYAVQGLAAIVAGIFQVAARTPLADAIVGVVPGLAGQSRVGNNEELARLNCEKWRTAPKFYAVTSNFEPQETDVGWQIWKYLRNPKDKLLNMGADLIFQNEPNDLVVNTQSMTQLYRTVEAAAGPFVPIIDVWDFDGSSRVVHHTNYFRQAETVKFLMEKLKL